MNITVIGTGYVGLVTGACFSKMGNKVYCVDIDEDKIKGLKNNILPIFEPNLDTIVKTSQDRGDLIFTTSIKEALDNTDIVFIAVGTPMADDGSANLDYIFSAAKNIADNLTHDSLIVIKSTVPVGTAFKVKEEIMSILDERNADVRIDIASNPEFLKEGSAVEDCLRPDRVVLGVENDKTVEILRDLYSSFVSTVGHMRKRSASLSSPIPKYAQLLSSE